MIHDSRRQDNNKSVWKSLWCFLGRVAGRFSLRLVFSLPFMLQFLIVTCLIGFLLFRGGQEAVGSVLIGVREEALERVHDQLSRHMHEPLRLNQMNVDAWRVGILRLSDTTERERQFVNHIQAFPDVAMTFVGLADGEFYGARRKVSGEVQVVRNDKYTGGASWYYKISTQGDGIERQEVYPNFDARTRPWYQTAQSTGKPIFSGVYRHFVFLEPTITATYPIFYENGQLAGVFGVDYLLSWLGDMLRKLSVGPSGQVFITDREEMIVAASVLKEPFEERNGQFVRIRAEDCKDPVLRMAVKSLPNNIDGFYNFKLDDRSYSVSTSSFKEDGIDWNIYVVLADEDFMGGIRGALLQTTVVTLLLTIAVFVLAVWTAGWVTRPILRLNESAYQLAQGRLNLVPDTERKDELGQLSRSFNKMAQQIFDLVSNLEARVKERTKDLAEKTREEQEMRETFHGELAKAGSQQRAMLPENINDVRVNLQILYEPCMLVSGDSCGYRWMGNDSLFGYIIDVTGHGVATALQTAAMSVMFQEIIYTPCSLSERMSEINRRVTGYFGDEVMVAAFCFELDLRQRELRYGAAGITEFFADCAKVQGRVKVPGLFLGVSENPQYEIYSLSIKEGDCFCFYSDGIADRFNEGSELPLGADFTDLVDHMGKIAIKGMQHDDVTALCLRVGKLEDRKE